MMDEEKKALEDTVRQITKQLLLTPEGWSSFQAIYQKFGHDVANEQLDRLARKLLHQHFSNLIWDTDEDDKEMFREFGELAHESQQMLDDRSDFNEEFSASDMMWMQSKGITMDDLDE